MKEYILKPIMTPTTVNLALTADKPAVARTRPPRQPLPTAVLEPAKPRLALGLDVHLEFIIAVAQKDHAGPQAPRKFSREQLVAQVKKCGQRRLGSIDRMGNGRVRCVLVEAVWRLLRWQPGWKAARHLTVKLADSKALRKKTVVALARRLAIDLWRWRTGRATFADLGWIAA